MKAAELSKDELVELNQQQAEKIAFLERRLRLILSKQYGRKSEKIPDSQLELFGQSTEDQKLEEEGAEEKITVSYKRKRGKRKSIDPNLERHPIHYELSDTDKQCECGGVLKEIGTIASEQYEYIPAQVVVLEHIQHKYACPCCQGKVVLAKKPDSILPKTNAAAGLLAHLVTTKYVDGVPLHRQETQLARLGIDLARNTMARWLIALSDAVIPLLNLIEDAIRAGPFIQCDETPFQVLSEQGRKATALSYMWVMRGGLASEQAVIYHYDPSRSSSVVKTLFADYKGIVQCDGYSAYRCLEEQGVVLVGCMAHARRKFDEALQSLGKDELTQRSKAGIALNYFGKLYKIEAKLKDSCDEKRYEVRQAESLPILQEFKEWLDQQSRTTLPKSAFGNALNYTLRQWEKLIRYCDYGFVPIDNNADERAIRPFAIGRRNWLFSASTKGADANARFYSLIETCKINGHEPYAYLKYIFKELTKAETVEDYEALLPWKLDAATVREVARNL